MRQQQSVLAPVSTTEMRDSSPSPDPAASTAQPTVAVLDTSSALSHQNITQAVAEANKNKAQLSLKVSDDMLIMILFGRYVQLTLLHGVLNSENML